jgi:hypothetical protein
MAVRGVTVRGRGRYRLPSLFHLPSVLYAPLLLRVASEEERVALIPSASYDAWEVSGQQDGYTILLLENGNKVAYGYYLAAKDANGSWETVNNRRCSLRCRRRSVEVDMLDQLGRAAEHYSRLLDPSLEPRSSVREALRRLNRLEATVTYPCLLNIYKAEVPESDLVEILATLENFILRRYICRTLRADLNKLLPTLYKNAQNYSSISKGVREILAARIYSA